MPKFEIEGTKRHRFARSYKYCTDVADSFNRYVGTYCHLKQVQMVDVGTDRLDQCFTCESYERRETNNRTKRRKKNK